MTAKSSINYNYIQNQVVKTTVGVVNSKEIIAANTPVDPAAVEGGYTISDKNLSNAQLARVDNANLREQIGQINSGNVSQSRNIPPIASDNAPSGPPSDQSVRSRLMNGVRTGEVDGGAAALAMGLVEGYRGQ